MTPEQFLTAIASRYDEESAKWAIRMEVTGARFALNLSNTRRDTSGMARWEIERYESRAYEEWVHEWAASVAFAMWVTSDVEFPFEFLSEMTRYAPHESDFLLDVASEARHLHGLWVAAGGVTDEWVLDRVVARMGDVIRDEE